MSSCVEVVFFCDRKDIILLNYIGSTIPLEVAYFTIIVALFFLGRGFFFLFFSFFVKNGFATRGSIEVHGVAICLFCMLRVFGKFGTITGF